MKFKSVLSHQERNIPKVEVRELPSGFKLYSDDIKIFISPLTVGEQNELSSVKSVKDKIRVMLSGIHIEGMDREDLAFFDFVFLVVLRVMLSYSTQRYKFVSKCPKCKSENELVLSPSDLDFKDLKVSLPVRIRFSTVGELEFMPFSIKKYLSYFKENLQQVEYAGMMVCNYSYEEAVEKLKSLTIEEGEALRELDKLLDFGLKSVEFRCKNKEKRGCGFVYQVFLEGVDFIYPFREQENGKPYEISFG